MTILTLTTDYGYRDFYQAAIKGALHRLCPEVQIVDITHDITPFDIVNAAYQLKNCYKSFPLGTIHVVCVNNSPEQFSELIMLEEKGQFFLGFDNGLFSLVFEERTGVAIQVDTSNNFPFVFNNFLGRVVKQLIDNKPITEFGKTLNAIKEVLTLQPVISPNEIRASIVHIDHFGNVITNLHVTLFESIWKDRDFSINIKKHEELSKISKHFGGASIGELVAIFNESGYLMIAINMGNVASLLSLNRDDIIQIEFKK